MSTQKCDIFCMHEPNVLTVRNCAVLKGNLKNAIKSAHIKTEVNTSHVI